MDVGNDDFGVGDVVTDVENRSLGVYRKFGLRGRMVK